MVRAWIIRLASMIFTAPWFWKLRRVLFRLGQGAKRQVFYFHQADDPYSYLASQVLATLLKRHDIELIPMLVGPPPASAAPERALLAAYGRRDVVRFAGAYGLNPPTLTDAPPDPRLTVLAETALSAGIAAGNFPDMAPQIGDALWRGDEAALTALINALPPQSAGSREKSIEAGNAKRASLGHYLGAMFYFEGEFYWGLDRLHFLETRLGAARPIAPAREAVLGPVPRFAAPPEIEFWFSIRSPYSWLSFPRVVELAHHYGARLKLRFVLPMVMRGLPVPRVKSTYITFDNVREAARVGLPFGPIVDPVGAGTERSLAVLHHAIPLGTGEAFAHAALRGCWTQGIDLASDHGLARVAKSAGVSEAVVTQALADQSWRDAAEANRLALFDAGLWGVPSFRVNGKPAHWGQDRIWMLEQDILNEAQL